MNLVTIKYFKKTDQGICGEDLSRKDDEVTINLDFLLSLSSLKEFELPFSGKPMGKYSILTMSNNDIYYIRESSYNQLHIIFKSL